MNKQEYMTDVWEVSIIRKYTVHSKALCFVSDSFRYYTVKVLWVVH